MHTDARLNIGEKSNELMCAPTLMREIPVTTFSVRILTEGLPSSKKREIIKAPLNAQEETLITFLVENLGQHCGDNKSVKKKHTVFSQKKSKMLFQILLIAFFSPASCQIAFSPSIEGEICRSDYFTCVVRTPI